MNSLRLCFFMLINECIVYISSTTCGEKPIWNAKIKAHERRLIISWLLENDKTCDDSEVEYPGFDGWYHNLAKIEQGSVGQKLLRGWAGIRSDLSRSNNWLKLWSQIISNIKMCKDSNNGLALFIGKQVVSEILDTGDSNCAGADGLKYLHYESNLASPYIDGGIIYGTNRSWATRHISENGTISTHNIFFQNVENIYTAALKTVWIKWHNIITEEFRKKCPKWSAYRIYSEARKFTIALQQRIYVYEWLPTWIGKSVKPYERYDPLVDPQVEKLFQVATYLLQLIAEPHCDVKTCKNIHSSHGWRYNYHREVIRFLMQDSCKTHEKYESVKNTKQYHRLPDINHARRVFSLRFYSGWEEFATANKINNDTLIALLFTGVDFQQLDSMVGGILESINGPGQLFVEVIRDQFRRTRDGDRFWFENRQNNLFSATEICKINKISFIDILLTVIDITDGVLGNQSAFQIYRDVHNALPDFIQLNGSAFKPENLHLIAKDIIFYKVLLIALVVGYCLVIAIISFILTIVKRIQTNTKQAKENQAIKELVQDRWEIRDPLFVAYEYDGTESRKRVVLVLDKQKKQIIVRFTSGVIKRIIGFEVYSKAKIEIMTVSNEPIVILKSPKNYDLILCFESTVLQDSFSKELSNFIAEVAKDISPELNILKWKVAKKQLLTKKHHQTLLEMFLRVAIAQAFKIEHSLEEILGVDTSIAIEVVHTELTLIEFSECLRMSPESEFVKTVFSLVDRDQKGFICFRAFLDFIILFANGKEEEKAHLLFKLYDIDGTALLPAKDFQAMLKSFLEIVDERCTEDIVQKSIKQSHVDHKDKLDFLDFKRVIAHHLKNLSRANLNCKKFVQNDHSYLSLARQSLQAMLRCNNPPSFGRMDNFSAVDQEQQKVIKVPERKKTIQKVLIYLGSCSTQSFWFALITLVISYVFIDKSINFYRTINLTGMNRYILAISKGAIYGILLSYSVLFITAGRIILNRLATIQVFKYIPLMNMETIYYYAGSISFIFTTIHVVGYVHLSMSVMAQTADSTCNDTGIRDEDINSIQLHWKNPVPLSGLLLVFLLIPVYIFLEPHLRHLSKTAFYFTHNLYPLIMILLVIHGLPSEKCVLYSILCGPIILYLLDTFIGMRRRKVNLPILKVDFLPTDVMRLTLKRPENFQYEVGQWTEIVIPQVMNEFYRYVLASAPSDPDLCIYVHPSDPCAYQLRALAEVPGKEHAPAPIRVRLDGPFGDGLQKWLFYNVSIFIGGGSGVELFASVLKDIAYVLESQTEKPCKKVYFIWTSKTQKDYEWIIHLIKEVEDKDQTQLFSAHLFITELYENFDIRTILLKIGEKHYPKISGKSIFTSLKAVTHFGRPNIPKCLETIQSLHKTTKTVGVFSSGPISLMRVVSEACSQINVQSGQVFEHCFCKYN